MIFGIDDYYFFKKNNNQGYIIQVVIFGSTFNQIKVHQVST